MEKWKRSSIVFCRSKSAEILLHGSNLPFDDVGWCRCVQTPPGSVDEAEVGDEIRFRALLPCHDVKKLTEIIVYAK